MMTATPPVRERLRLPAEARRSDCRSPSAGEDDLSTPMLGKGSTASALVPVTMLTTPARRLRSAMSAISSGVSGALPGFQHNGTAGRQRRADSDRCGGRCIQDVAPDDADRLFAVKRRSPGSGFRLRRHVQWPFRHSSATCR